MDDVSAGLVSGPRVFKSEEGGTGYGGGDGGDDGHVVGNETSKRGD
jgi:hypothetical protein